MASSSWPRALTRCCPWGVMPSRGRRRGSTRIRRNKPPARRPRVSRGTVGRSPSGNCTSPRRWRLPPGLRASFNSTKRLRLVANLSWCSRKERHMLVRWSVRWTALGVLMVGGCTLPESPIPETVPSTPPALMEAVAVLQQDVAVLKQQVGEVEERVQRTEQVLPDQAAQIQALLPLLKVQAQQRPKARPLARPTTPLQIVTQAQQQAQQPPTERCYYAGSGECLFLYQPGRIYTVYLTSWHPTVIALEPGERLSI